MNQYAFLVIFAIACVSYLVCLWVYARQKRGEQERWYKESEEFILWLEAMSGGMDRFLEAVEKDEETD